jgi:hypothetical protein
VNNIVAVSLSQLLTQAPVLVAYVTGLFLALTFWNRCPPASMLTFLAMGILLLTTVALPLVQNYFMMTPDLGWTVAQHSIATAAIAIVGSFIRALAFALLLGAVFIDRKPSRVGPA